MFPKYLYRGDSDPKNDRNLKLTLNSSVIKTNLCNGGNGREIFNDTLYSIVNKHIHIGWDKTHFLSFSTDEQIAFQYANREKREYEEIFDSQENWDFAVLTIDTSVLTYKRQIATGIYCAHFYPYSREFQPFYRLILIDTYTYLKSNMFGSIDLSQAITKATESKEWLILPAMPFGNGECSSKLDVACFKERRMFKIM